MAKRRHADVLNEQWLVYVLIDPRTNWVRYVGRTTDTVKRLAQHHASPKSRPVRRWIDELAACGLKPRLELRFICRGKVAAVQAEAAMIQACFDSYGDELLNVAGKRSEAVA
jgi:predicted GIY-YIG superfamily endonuclease